jgi:hypothetical protein
MVSLLFDLASQSENLSQGESTFGLNRAFKKLIKVKTFHSLTLLNFFSDRDHVAA